MAFGMRLLRGALRWLRERRRGQALVEFALLLPMLMLLVLGAVDFGRVMYSVVTVNNAAFHSALWSSYHMRQGTTACGGSSTTICCPVENNTTAINTTTPTRIRDVVIRDFLVGLPYTDTCPSATSSVSSSCNPAVSCSTTLETDYTYGSGTAYRLIDVTVTYSFAAVGPYDALLGQIDIPRNIQIRKVP